MAKTHIDELVDYPAKVILKLANDKNCLSLLKNKIDISEEDIDDALINNIFDYEYVDKTTTSAEAYIWVEADVPYVSNKTIKGMAIYVTIACHKQFMKLDNRIFKGLMGNRRDNIARFVDLILNDNFDFGIGKLSLKSVKTLSSSNSNFTMRELAYAVPDFNIKENIDETGVS